VDGDGQLGEGEFIGCLRRVARRFLGRETGEFAAGYYGLIWFL
jgi:hypothetical protein